MVSPIPPVLPTDVIGGAVGHLAHHEAIHTYLGTLPAAVASNVLVKRTVAGAYTLVAADSDNRILHSTSALGFTITLPQDSAAAIAQEVAIPWRQYGVGQITFAAGSGATLLSRGSVFKSAGQYSVGLLTKVAANTWLLGGDIVA